MVSATRTDKICKELLAVVDEFADYQYAIGRLSRRVLPNAGKTSTTRIQGREMMVGRNVKDRMCEIFMRGAQDARPPLPPLLAGAFSCL